MDSLDHLPQLPLPAPTSLYIITTAESQNIAHHSLFNVVAESWWPPIMRTDRVEILTEKILAISIVLGMCPGLPSSLENLENYRKEYTVRKKSRNFLI